MSKLISKDALISEIVNTLTNSDCYNPVYLNGSATRQLEILNIIDSLQTVSDKEIRDKAIEEFVNWSYLHGIDFSYMSTAKKSGRQFCDDVINRYKTEQMKGVDE